MYIPAGGKFVKAFILAGSIYFFLVSIKLMAASFRLFGAGFVEELMAPAANPIVGLFIGILVTSIIQSSSATTAIVIGMVAAGSLDIAAAIPIIMGSNVGTTVTSIMVSLGHVSRRREFKLALAGATMHDFFNLLAVAIFLPIEMVFHPLQHVAVILSGAFEGVGGLEFVSPIKIIIGPIAETIAYVLGQNAIAVLVVGLFMLFMCLKYIVSSIRDIALEKIEAFLDVYLFRNAASAFLLGLILTAILQSSSVTISLVIPLIGAGVLAIRKVFPYTMGANIGTTVTGFLAALAISTPLAITVAMVHFLFNFFGACVIYPIRRIPIGLAERFGALAAGSRRLAFLYLAVVFYLFPLLVILLLR